MKFQNAMASALTLAALLFAAAPAQATTDVFSFSDSVDGIFAFGQFTVADNSNALGTYDITQVSGTVINASFGPSDPIIDQIAGIVANPGQPSPTVADGFLYDDVTPLNSNGVLFVGDSSAIYNLWSDGGQAGELYTYGVSGMPNFDAHGVLTVSAIPEPAAWAMMLFGFGGLGAAMRARRRQVVASA